MECKHCVYDVSCGVGLYDITGMGESFVPVDFCPICGIKVSTATVKGRVCSSVVNVEFEGYLKAVQEPNKYRYGHVYSLAAFFANGIDTYPNLEACLPDFEKVITGENEVSKALKFLAEFYEGTIMYLAVTTIASNKGLVADLEAIKQLSIKSTMEDISKVLHRRDV